MSVRRRELITVAEAAEREGRNVFFVRRLIKRRAIAHYPVGGRVLLDVADLEAFLDAVKVEPEQAP